MPHISGGQIEDFEARIPSPDLQNRIADKLDAACANARDLIKAYEGKIAEIGSLRQSILHRAFSGQLT